MGKRDFLEITQFTAEEVRAFLRRAGELKAMRKARQPHQTRPGRTLGLIFEKASTRTRVSFEVGMLDLGGHVISLSPRDTQLGRGEPIRDTARVLSRYLDALVVRTFAEEKLLEMARWASIPVINGLTDLTHPCQVLTDVFTAEERLAVAIEDLTVAWIGDGNNMANSWINAASVLGFRLRLACPERYRPDAATLRAAQARTPGLIEVFTDPKEAVAGAQVINTDVWASMGQEEEAEQRRRAFADYVVDAKLIDAAQSRAIVLHCLPAHRGEEIAEDVLEGPHSAIFDQAENRLHVQKALLEALMA